VCIDAGSTIGSAKHRQRPNFTSIQTVDVVPTAGQSMSIIYLLAVHRNNLILFLCWRQRGRRCCNYHNLYN